MERSLLLVGLLAVSALARDCGKPNDARFIVNGEEATPHAYPWVVALESSYGTAGLGSVSLHCAGSVLSPDWVVTAGHCVDVAYTHEGRVLDQVGLNVYFGKHDLTIEEEGEVKINVPKANLIRNANYSKYFQYDYDIALIQLPEPIEYTDNIQPICLPTLGEIKPNGTKVMNVGWGYMYGMELPNVLQQGEDQVLDNEACGKYYAPYGLDITDRMMCTASEPTAQCNGDSGGPVMWMNENGQYILHGTVSFSVKDPVEWCIPGMPAAQANVANLVDWIKEVTGL